MIDIFYIFLGITLLFIFLLGVKELLQRKLCVICASISLTWLTLLALYWLGYFRNVVILALLLGQSIVGIYYLLEKKLDEKYHLFRLPFLLTLTFVFYLLMRPSNNLFAVITLLAVLWLVMAIVYNYRQTKKFQRIVQKLINCCKGW